MPCLFFFFKQKTAYEITEGDWSSDVCSSDLARGSWRRGAGSSGRATRPAGSPANRAAGATAPSATARRYSARSTGIRGPGTRPAGRHAASPIRPAAERCSRPRGGDAEVLTQQLEIERLLPHAQVVVEQGEHTARERIKEQEDEPDSDERRHEQHGQKRRGQTGNDPEPNQEQTQEYDHHDIEPERPPPESLGERPGATQPVGPPRERLEHRSLHGDREAARDDDAGNEIGRASCRERVSSVV